MVSFIDIISIYFSNVFITLLAQPLFYIVPNFFPPATEGE